MISSFDFQGHGNLILTLLDYKMYNCDICCFNKPKRIELLKETFLFPSYALLWPHTPELISVQSVPLEQYSQVPSA